MKNPQIIMKSIDSIIPYERNPRINKDAVKYVANSIQNFGFKQPIVIDANGIIVAGHTRHLAAKQLELTEVPCVIADDLTEDQIRMYRLADNKVAEFSIWDKSLLDGELDDLNGLFDFGDFGFAGLDVELPGNDEDFNPDEALEKIEEPITKPGDIWILGKHRLICGDSCNADTVLKLMDGNKADLLLTDPPYNVAYEGGTKEKLKIQNDSMDSEKFLAFLTDAFAAADGSMKEGCPFYIWHASAEVFNFYNAVFNVNGWMPKEYLIWEKDKFTLGRQDYQWRHEPCQPSGTMVLMSNGLRKSIEKIKPGDHVVSYDSLSGQIKGMRNGGYEVSAIAKRFYSGKMYHIIVDGKETRATNNHQFSIRFNPNTKKKYCTYLMRRGNWWRVGHTIAYDARQFGLKTRMHQELADEAWIIDMFETSVDAQAGEQIIAVKYGIPYTIWEPDIASRNGKRTKKQIKSIYSNLDIRKLKECAHQLLSDYGRDVHYPLICKENQSQKFSTRFTIKINSCNLIPELMQLPIPTKNSAFKWESIKKIKLNDFNDYVYSIKVEKYEHYIADGIVTHNCIYGWKEGAAHYWCGDRKQSTILEFDKPNANKEHPTMKPVELFERLILNSSKEGECILDSFGGSGTTIIACEKNKRRGFSIELDPKYCDVIVKCWENLTGSKAELLKE